MELSVCASHAQNGYSLCEGGWVGGWVSGWVGGRGGRGGSNEVLDARRGWMGGWVGGLGEPLPISHG